MARVRTHEGAVAVEAALVLCFVIVPLLLGVVHYGTYFWHAQRVDAYAWRIPQDAIVGRFTCAELVARVQSLAAGLVANVGDALPAPPSPTGIVVDVIRVVPEMGADVRIALTVPVVTQVLPWLPLPNGGAVVTEFLTRLENVQVTTTSC